MHIYRIDEEKARNETAPFVRQGDEIFFDQLKRMTQLLSAEEGLRMIGLTGPTCSGKTTAARMITEALGACGKTVKMISIDDFYFDKSYLEILTRQKGMDTLDYDSEDTIDVELLRDCVEELRAGKAVRLPRFNFVSGQREEGDLITPAAEDIFLFEGIQVLYPSVDAILRGEGYRSVFIAPMSAIEIGGELFQPNDLRLMRRLVRDAEYRNTEPAFTLFLWSGVRENEEKSIFPYANGCDYRIDSTMVYEVGVLKPYLQRELDRIPHGDRYRSQAEALIKRLDRVEPISRRFISEKSLYKEFII